ncbi:MAG: TlpA family protein disulfide reductase [Rhodanobacter thiooxydans]|nr:TlpA family protein disulfide reductase [Rhodanobacter thiooxydans]
MTLFSSLSRSAAALAMALAFAVPAQAAMPAQPTLHVATLDGKTFDLAAQRGKWVIVNYWATWCVPCIKEMPDISRFVAAHNNVTAIGLAYEDSEPADIKAFLVKHPVVYPIAQVTMDNPPKDFDEPRGLPTTYLISPDGKVAKHIVGPVTEASLEAIIGGH